MFTPPVADSPVEASEEEVETWNSWMDSWVRFSVVVCPFVIVMRVAEGANFCNEAGACQFATTMC